jgi:uncharacterized membrane protein
VWPEGEMGYNRDLLRVCNEIRVEVRRSLMNRFSKLLLVGTALAFMAPAVAAPTLTFKFTTLNIPGSMQAYANGISEAGVIAGTYFDTVGIPHGFTLKGKTVTKIDDPKGLGTFAQGISPNGSAIVGYYINSTGKNFGFLMKGKKFTDVLGPKGAFTDIAYGVNDGGEVVGLYVNSASKKQGFRLLNGKYTTMDIGSSFTSAQGVNNSGDIVLYWADSGGNFESSLYDGKTYKTINVPGALSSFAWGINNAGDVVYWFVDSTGYHGALRLGSKYYSLNDPKGVAETYGYGLNDHRQIVGSYGLSPHLNGYEATY